MLRTRGLVSFLAAGAMLAASLPAAANAGTRSRDGVWRALTAPAGGAPGAPAAAAARLYQLNDRRLAAILAAAPREFTRAAAGRQVALSLPLPDGTYVRVRVEKSPVLSAALQRRRRGIATYRGQGIDDKAVTARFDVTPLGFHAQVLSPAGAAYVDPAGPPQRRRYASYWSRDLGRRRFGCSVQDSAPSAPGPAAAPRAGEFLRVYRLAVTATGEYTRYFGGTAAAAEAQIVTTVNRVNGIYERDLAARFTVTQFNVYLDPGADPYPAGPIDDAFLDLHQADLVAKYGAGAFDLGHVVSQGGRSGRAGVGAACDDARKGRGGTSLPSPAGDGFDVDLVAHEIGHQMGGRHTFNSLSGSCGDPGERVAETAFEPGSGSTVMGYAGLCGGENVQANSDDYFHGASLDDLGLYRGGVGGTCGTETPTGNAPPAVDAGPDFVIPRGTPFVLTAAGSDADGDSLTYCWEQFDPGAPSPPLNTVDGPLFRSRPPSASPARSLPPLADLLAGTSSPWEQLPVADRVLNFRVTARDNRAGGGGVSHDAMSVGVAGEPFALLSPASGETLECGGPSSLSWSVGGGSVAAQVRPSFSFDDGASFAPPLPDIDNDGLEGFTVPRLPTPGGRVRLDAVGNIFFSLSGRFAIADTLDPTVTAPADARAECASPAGTAVDLGTALAADLCDATPDIANDAPGLFPLGDTTVTWKAADDSGHFATDTQLVTVLDTIAPTIDAPPDLTRECASPLGTRVDLGTPTASDVCDASVTVANDAPLLFPLGLTTVTWTATDDSRNASTDTQAVRIVDTTPPLFTLVLTPDSLWPPNHKLVTVRAAITVNEACDAAPSVRLVSITSSEPDNGKGDGNTAGDIQGAAIGTDDREFELRTERAGGGTGRSYTVTYSVTDASGNSATHEATVSVPHDRR